MKKLFYLVVFSFVIISCEGEQGPPGQDGQDGQDGQMIKPQAVEVTIDLRGVNGYYEFLEYPDGVSVEESDVIMAFQKVVYGVNGEYIWEPLPRILFGNSYTYSYLYDYDPAVISFFIDGSNDWRSHMTEEMNAGLIFRYVIIPTELIQGVDTTNYDSIMQTLNIKEIKSLN
ncbi:hypothetical protein SAMN04487906_2933 [Zhouia amylolytica]|uniref:Collagen triple helix repeat-containing protein n=1 Tax=Zhouia amylolytica TaxID=376730 RepID=A0A1I6V801_9FLAO|nr:hypothetical protein [Zhouia amylolytica]MCQ0109965.1 hypothetical protein [Zhouia amylolytica]SFT09796.1 hypothetical protein SAMN04487906_2933 [Zhouia amylolytica]